MNKKLLIGLVIFNLIVLLCWGGMELSRYIAKQNKEHEISAKITDEDVRIGVMTRPESEKFVKISWKASGKQIDDDDLDWVLALFDKKWKGANVGYGNSIARGEIVHFLTTVKTLTISQRNKMTTYGMGLLPDISKSDVEARRKQHFLLFCLATRDPRFIPHILKFSHDKDSDVSTTAKAVLKKLGVSTGNGDKTKP